MHSTKAISGQLMSFALLACLVGAMGCVALAADKTPADQTAGAPATDRVGFPKDYRKAFQVLRTTKREAKHQIVTIYGNAQAASVHGPKDLPYPFGSVLVMETSDAGKGNVVGMHVMRRERGFGAAYGDKRSGEWEFVEYRQDGSYITPPEKSAACAECHIKAGRDKDFVYKARLAGDGE
jgi:hypothetical protein